MRRVTLTAFIAAALLAVAMPASAQSGASSQGSSETTRISRPGGKPHWKHSFRDSRAVRPNKRAANDRIQLTNIFEHAVFQYGT